MSRPYLSARFIRETGISVTEYVLREKTEEAKKLLEYTDKPILAVGEYLGFSSQSHFTRVFKKMTGLPPGEYRKNRMQRCCFRRIKTAARHEKPDVALLCRRVVF